MPKVSVIIPVYGVEKYIERCARSLFEQTLDDIEYLFIDDYTPDKSIEVLKKVLEEYPNRKGQVIIHRMDQNSGQAAVRKWGMQNATSEYVIHCDSDDWVDTDMYRAMYEKAIEDNADMVVCDYYIVDSDNTQRSPIQFKKDRRTFIKEMCCFEVSWALWNKLVKRKIYKSVIVYPKDNMGEDMVLVMQFVNNSNIISYLDSPFYSYSINTDSIVHSMDVPSVIKKLNQKINNVKLLERLLSGKRDISTELLDYIKYNMLYEVSVMLPPKDVGNLLRSVFPEINQRLIFNPYLTIKNKVAYYARLIR